MLKTETTTTLVDKIDTEQKKQLSGLKSSLFLFASLAIAHCLHLTIHEFGHAIAYKIMGYNIEKIFLHPFDVSQVTTVNPMNFEVFGGLAGPLFDLIIATILFVSLWKIRRPMLLPLLLLGPFAYVVEGVSVIICVIDYPYLIGDWGDAIHAGVPIPVVITIGIIFIIIGLLGMPLVFPLANISIEEPFIKRLTIKAGGFIGYYLLSFLFVVIFNKWAIKWRGIALGFSIVLALILSIIYKPLIKIYNRFTHTKPTEMQWSTIGITLGIAAVIMTIQMLTYYLIPV
ncbi:MAG: hypothetical protein FK733_00905 [Asgard group archaeon]|nr:hypothetical protein [Asgard group archaeon]